jgi:hypothetical protein
VSTTQCVVVYGFMIRYEKGAIYEKEKRLKNLNLSSTQMPARGV